MELCRTKDSRMSSDRSRKFSWWSVSGECPHRTGEGVLILLGATAEQCSDGTYGGGACSACRRMRVESRLGSEHAAALQHSAIFPELQRL